MKPASLVVLTRDLPARGLRKGDVGTVVGVQRGDIDVNEVLRRFDPSVEEFDDWIARSETKYEVQFSFAGKPVVESIRGSYLRVARRSVRNMVLLSCILIGDVVLALCAAYLVLVGQQAWSFVLAAAFLAVWFSAGGLSHWKPSNIKAVFTKLG